MREEEKKLSGTVLSSLQSLRQAGRDWQEQGKRGIPHRKKSRIVLSQLCHQKKSTVASGTDISTHRWEHCAQCTKINLMGSNYSKWVFNS